MLAMIPEQLAMTKKLMNQALNDMYTNFNYFYQITAPLHNHKSFDQNIEQLELIRGNMTDLSSEMDTVKGALDTIEKQIHDTADKHFDENDKYINMDET